MNFNEFKKQEAKLNESIETAKLGKKGLFYEYEKSICRKIKQITGGNGNLFIGNALYKVVDGHIKTAIYQTDTANLRWVPIYNEEYDTDPYCDADGWDLDDAYRILTFLGDYLKDKFSIGSRFFQDENIGMIYHYIGYYD